VVFSLFLGAMLVIPVSINAWERIARRPFQFLYGSGGQIGARNLQRARMRTMLTTAALLVGVSMIIIIRGMTSSFAADLKDWMNAYIGGDLYINSSVPMRRELQQRFESLDSVDTAAPIRYLNVSMKFANGSEEQINFMAVDPEAYNRVTNFVFSDPKTDSQKASADLMGGNSVFISSVLAEKYGLAAGDSIYLQTRSGLRPFTISAVIVDFFNQGLVVTGSWTDMRRYYRTNEASTFLLKVKGGHNVPEVLDQIDALYGKRYRLILESNQSIKIRALALMDQSFRMFDVLGIIAVLVAALGVVNTLSMSVIERTREIGMLRSIGMTRWQVVKMILAEGLLLGLIGGFLGILFGVLLTRIFLLSMAAMSGYQLNPIIPVDSLGAGLFIALVISQLAAVLPALRAGRTPVLEAIHYE
jgi:putative ABC transport system permease protein